MNLRMTPLDFRPDGAPRDARLYESAKTFYENQFGETLDHAYYGRLWAAEAVCDDRVQVVGITGIRGTYDIPTFHVIPVSQDREGFKLAEETTAMMYFRLNNYLADLGNRGSTTMIYVAPQVERLWRRFLKRVGGKPANRWEVEVR
jgi:hypothetical protein